MPGVDGIVGNRALLQAVADSLDIEGVRRFPNLINTVDIKAVIDLGLFLQAGNRVDTIRQGDVATAGPTFVLDTLVQGNLSLVGPFPFSGAFRGISNNDDGARDVRVHALNVRLQLDAAGAVALAGAVIDCFLRFDNTAVAPSPAGGITNIYTGIFTIDAAITQYNITLGGFPSVDATSGGSERKGMDWSGFVPAGWVLSSLIATRGPAFPANSTYSARIAGSSYPKGFVPAR